MALSDLEKIQHDVLDVRSRALVAEVVRCYEAGAYRAALVSLWVAVVADLTEKIRYLAESGDGDARNVIHDLDKALADQRVNKVQQYERDILATVAQHLEILLPRERVELERLNADRNLCAHPGYLDESELFVPDAELVRAHLVAAIRCVFSQRPLAGKRLLVTLEAELEAEHWSSDADYFLERFFRPARERVKMNMAKVLIKHSIRPPKGSNRVASRALHAVLLIANESPSVFQEALRSVLHTWERAGSLGDSELVRVSGAYGNKAALWEAISSTGKTKLMAILNGCDIDFLVDERFFASGAPSDEGVAEKFQEIVSELNAEQIQRAVKYAMDSGPFIRPAIDLVRNSASFRSAEENLRVVELCSDRLDHDDVASLREAVQANPRSQVRLAGDTESILSSIYSASSSTEASRQEWLKLAEWLHETGEQNGDEYYLYGEFLKLTSERE